MTHIQIIVRTYLMLSDLQKIDVTNRLLLSEELRDIPFTSKHRDLAFFKAVKEKGLLAELWNEINKIKPFQNQINPFLS